MDNDKFSYLRKIKNKSLVRLVMIIPKKFLYYQFMRIKSTKVIKNILYTNFQTTTSSQLTGRQIMSLKGDSTITSISFSYDNNLIATTCSKCKSKIYGINPMIPSTFGKLIFEFNDHIEDIFCSAFSPNNNYFITGGIDAKYFIYGMNPANKQTYGKVVKEFVEDNDTYSIRSVCFSNNSKYLITGGYEKVLKIYNIMQDTTNSNSIFELNSKINVGYNIFGLCFSNDDKVIATCTEKNTLLYSIETNSNSKKNDLIIKKDDIIFNNGTRNYVVKFLDDKYLVIGDIKGKLSFFSCNKHKRNYGKLVHLIEHHSNRLLALDISNNEKYLITGSKDETCILYIINAKKNSENQENDDEFKYTIEDIKKMRIVSMNVLGGNMNVDSKSAIYASTFARERNLFAFSGGCKSVQIYC